MKLFVRDRQFYRTLLLIAVPIALQNLITVMVSMMDTLMIGQLGETQLSAASIASHLWFMLMVFNFGIAGGANVLLSQYWGKEDTATCRRVMAITYKITFGLSILFVLVSQLMPALFMSFFTTDAEVIAYGAAYLRVVGWSYPLYAIANITIMMLRSFGTVNISILVYLTSLVVNTALNYILIFGKCGAPAMGVVGGALATAVARLFELAIAVGYMLWKEKKLRFSLANLRGNNRSLYSKYFGQALPIIGNEIMWGLGTTLTSVVIGRMGVSFVAANSIYTVLNQFVTVLIFGVGNATLTIVGNTIGAGRYELAKQRSLTLYVLALGLGIFSAALTLLLGPILLLCYKTLSPETIWIMHGITKAGAVVVFFQSLAVVGMVGILRAGGDGKFVLICECTFLWGVAVPLGFITGLWLGWPAPVVFFCLKSDEFFKTVICSIRILRFRWLRDITIRD